MITAAMAQKVYLVTGVAGFIGSHLAEALLKQGHRVLGLDNFEPVYSVDKKKYNLNQVRYAAQGSDDFVFFEKDLRQKDEILKICGSPGLSGIFHLGALAGIQPSIQDPLKVLQVNVEGTLHLLEGARQNKIPNFLFGSSSSVYGANAPPWKESDPIAQPLSPYAVSKQSGELLIHSYHYLHGLNACCLRFFTVYGPRQRPDMAIYKFAKAMVNGEPITLFAEGKASRDFTFIDDCIQGILQAVNWLETSKPGENRFDIFNLGESQTVSLNEVVGHLEKHLNTKAQVHDAPLPRGDIPKSLADLHHSREKLDYKPKVAFAEGIQRFCEWYLTEEKDKPWA
jgi:UDP-glucuronate 4-epimerase